MVCFTDTICVGDKAERDCVILKASGKRFRIFSISFINNFLALLWNWHILVCCTVFNFFNSVLAPNPTLTDDVDKRFDSFFKSSFKSLYLKFTEVNTSGLTKRTIKALIISFNFSYRKNVSGRSDWNHFKNGSKSFTIQSENGKMHIKTGLWQASFNTMNLSG